MTYRAVDKLSNSGLLTATSTFVVTGAVPLSTAGSRNVRVDIEYSDSTVATGITAKLQQSNDSVVWSDVAGKTVSLTAAVATATLKTIAISSTVAADAALLPLMPLLRVEVVTQAGDSVTLTAAKITQDWP